MIWYRIDNRLIHGQIIEAWLPYTGADRLVVANESLAEDFLLQQIILLAVPARVDSKFVRLGELPELICEYTLKKEEALVLFDSCRDARKVFDLGLRFERCNIGNLPYSPGKKQICQNVALSGEDERCLRYFEDNSVLLDFRSIPADDPQVSKIW
jgi:PTS system mannose-specific IIB component